MSFIDKLKGTMGQGREALMKEVSKFKNREFMEATVAGCALIAYADGEVSSDEKKKMMGFIKNSEELKHFNVNDVIKMFQSYVEKMAFDLDIGKAEALKAIGKVAPKPEQARLVVRVCIAIGKSDGDFDDSEKTVVRQICRDMNLAADEFDL